MTKTLSKVGMQENFFDKDYPQKGTANITPNGEKPEAFPLRSGTRRGRPCPPLLFYIVLEVLVHPIRPEKEIKHMEWEGRSKNMFVHR